MRAGPDKARKALVGGCSALPSLKAPEQSLDATDNGKDTGPLNRAPSQEEESNMLMPQNRPSCDVMDDLYSPNAFVPRQISLAAEEAQSQSLLEQMAKVAPKNVVNPTEDDLMRGESSLQSQSKKYNYERPPSESSGVHTTVNELTFYRRHTLQKEPDEANESERPLESMHHSQKLNTGAGRQKPNTMTSSKDSAGPKAAEA